MRSVLTGLTIGLAISVAVAVAADNSIGTWRLNMEKSKFTPSAPVKSLTVTREASDDGIKVTTTGERSDGTPINASYTAKYDGKEYSVTGAPYNSISITRVNENTFTSTQKHSDTKYRTTIRSVISKDGKMMTNTVSGTNADGTPIHYTMVFDKE